jgi:hypothetical protein
MGRSIGAVVLGFLYVLASDSVAWVVLSFAIVQESETEPIPEVRWVVMVVCAFVGAGVGGFMTAHFVRGGELTSGLVLGAVLVIALGIVTLVVETEPTPPWYQLALPGVSLPGTLLGAYLRTRVPRPTPPALPKPP